MNWEKANEWEKNWWGDCLNTYGEETKQLLYAKKMGLKAFHNTKSPYNFDLKGKSVIDIGGGPASLLLKCVNGSGMTVVDPLPVPEFVRKRYSLADISFINVKAEELLTFIPGSLPYDEAWIYNVLQHVEDPKKVIDNAKKVAKVIRIFEWVNASDEHGHPHALKEEDLNNWLEGEGKTEYLSGENQCWGTCFFGVFPT